MEKRYEVTISITVREIVEAEKPRVHNPFEEWHEGVCMAYNYVEDLWFIPNPNDPEGDGYFTGEAAECRRFIEEHYFTEEGELMGRSDDPEVAAAYEARYA